jgi:branched-chain amino acid transport system substrate-binding protein
MPRKVLAAAALAAIALAAGGCGGASHPFTIGVVTDCEGVFAPYSPDVLAAAELPLLERGAKLAGRVPADGVKAAKVGGRHVKVVQGCAEITGLTELIENVRRLIEADRADVVVAPMLGQAEGIVLQELARKYPAATFVLGNSYAQEPTLRNPPPNLFRFVADAAQGTAGLGSYAYHVLGWRTAALVIGEDNGPEYSWPEAAGFVAEFCTSGGRVERIPAPAGATAAEPHVPKDVDGVALIARTFPDTVGFAAAYAKQHPDLARHLVLGPGVLTALDPTLLGKVAPLLRGVVVSGFSHDSQAPDWVAYRNAFHSRFPGLTAPPDPADAFLEAGYYDSVEATLRALERGGPFRRALAATSFEAPNGPLRLDRDRQAVVSETLSRFDVTPKGPAIRTVRVLPRVEQTFAGYFSATSPTPTVSRPGCHGGTVPPWAK